MVQSITRKAYTFWKTKGSTHLLKKGTLISGLLLAAELTDFNACAQSLVAPDRYSKWPLSNAAKITSLLPEVGHLLAD